MTDNGSHEEQQILSQEQEDPLERLSRDNTLEEQLTNAPAPPSKFLKLYENGNLFHGFSLLISFVVASGVLLSGWSYYGPSELDDHVKLQCNVVFAFFLLCRTSYDALLSFDCVCFRVKPRSDSRRMVLNSLSAVLVVAIFVNCLLHRNIFMVSAPTCFAISLLTNSVNEEQHVLTFSNRVRRSSLLLGIIGFFNVLMVFFERGVYPGPRVNNSWIIPCVGIFISGFYCAFAVSFDEWLTEKRKQTNTRFPKRYYNLAAVFLLVSVIVSALTFSLCHVFLSYPFRPGSQLAFSITRTFTTMLIVCAIE